SERFETVDMSDQLCILQERHATGCVRQQRIEVFGVESLHGRIRAVRYIVSLERNRCAFVTAENQALSILPEVNEFIRIAQVGHCSCLQIRNRCAHHVLMLHWCQRNSETCQPADEWRPDSAGNDERFSVDVAGSGFYSGDSTVCNCDTFYPSSRVKLHAHTFSFVDQRLRQNRRRRRSIAR